MTEAESYNVTEDTLTSMNIDKFSLQVFELHVPTSGPMQLK